MDATDPASSYVYEDPYQGIIFLPEFSLLQCVGFELGVMAV